jgi:hypothetical protein
MAPHFHRELLPAPRVFYKAALGRLSRPNRNGWCQACCPFHRGKSGRSFSVNITTLSPLEAFIAGVAMPAGETSWPS